MTLDTGCGISMTFFKSRKLREMREVDQKGKRLINILPHEKNAAIPNEKETTTNLLCNVQGAVCR